MTQGDFFSTTIGPYDMWAIEYGYKPLKGGSPDGEVAELRKIAARSGEKGLAFASDRRRPRHRPRSAQRCATIWATTWWRTPRSQAKLVAESWPNVVDDMTKDGDGYQRARRAFGVLLARHGAGDVLRGPVRRRPVREPQPQGRRERGQAVGSRPGRAAARSAGTVGRAGLRRHAVQLPARSVQPTGGVALGSLGHRSGRARRLSGARHHLDVAGPHPEPAALAADAVAAARQRAESCSRCRRAHRGRVAGAAHQSDLHGSRHGEDGRFHEPQAGDFQPAAQPAAGVSAADVAAWRWVKRSRRRIARRSPSPSSHG